MKNKTLIYLLFIIATIHNSFSQSSTKKDTLYFNSDWKETTKENHAFYRPLPLKTIDSLSLIQDFYKNGNMQMQGYVYTNNEDKFAGDVYWYSKKGDDASNDQYINTTNKPLTYYHHNGNVWKTNTYKNTLKVGTVKLYNDKGFEIGKEVYNNGLKVNDTLDKFTRHYYSTYGNAKIPFNKNVKRVYKPTKALYWMATGKLATVIHYDYTTIIGQEIYSKDGKLIKKYAKNDFLNNQLINGNHYKVQTANGFAVSIDSTTHSSQQSQVVNINNVDLINTASNGYINFYKKVNTDTYTDFNFKLLYENNSKVVSASFKSNGYHTSNTSAYNDIHDKNDITITIDQVKEQSISQLFESLKTVEWSSHYNHIDSYDNDTTKHKTTFKYYNNHIFTYVDEEYAIDKRGGFGSFYTDEDKDVKKWRIDNLDFYDIRVFMLNGTRPIVILSEDYGIEHYIIPTKDGGFVTSFEDSKHNKSKQQPYAAFTNQTLEQLMLSSNSKQFYTVKKQNKKHFIANIFNELAVKKAYDSIQLVHQYIIGRNTNEIDIYNTQLQKLPIKNIQQAYYDRGNLQILSNNRHYYIDALGNETKQRSITYSFCGTVSSTDFTILPVSNKKHVQKIKIYFGGMGRGYSYNKILKIKNLDASYNLTFLNKTKNEGYDGNSSFVDGYVNRSNMLVAAKNNKYGLYSFNHRDVVYKSKVKKNEKDKSGRPVIHRPSDTKYGSTDAKELLPVLYDAIELRDPLIIVKKNNSYGIYPLKNGLKYKTLGKIYNNYMSYETLNGKKGWIDVNTHEELSVE